MHKFLLASYSLCWLLTSATETCFAQWVHPPEAEKISEVPGLQHHTFESSAMATAVGYNVVLPTGYADGDRQHPVVYWLHGGGGNESSDLFVVQKWRAQFKATAEVPEPILVFPNGFRSGYMDHHDGKIMVESMIIQELIPLVDSNYRTIAGQEGRAVHGFSMGSSGSFKFATKYPDMFCAAVGYGGGAIDLATTESRFVLDILERNLKSDPDLIRANNTYHFVEQNSDAIRAADIHFLLVTGEADDWKQTAVDFEALLETHEIESELILVPDVAHDIRKLHELYGEQAIRFQQTVFRNSQN